MVHALRRAGGYLRRGGMLVSIRPHRTWRPSIAIVAGRSRVPVATLLNTAFEVNLAAAESALERVVDEGSFAPRVQPARVQAQRERGPGIEPAARGDRPVGVRSRPDSHQSRAGDR